MCVCILIAGVRVYCSVLAHGTHRTSSGSSPRGLFTLSFLSFFVFVFERDSLTGLYFLLFFNSVILWYLLYFQNIFLTLNLTDL